MHSDLCSHRGFPAASAPAGLGWGWGWGWKGIGTDLRGLGPGMGPVGRYEQMPCLSRPAPTFSLGHLEEGVPGQMAAVRAEV